MSPSPGRITLIGVGNRFRCDDAAGLVAVERLREVAPAEAEVVQLEGEPISLLDAWAGSRLAIVIDAVRSGADPGTIHRVNALTEPLPEPVAGPSTHALGLGEAIGLARALDRLPERLTVIGIEGERFEAGEDLTEAVQGAIEEAVAAAIEELGAATSQRPS